MTTIAITQGDINGIGYEVILKVFEDERMFELCTPVLYGSPHIAARYGRMMGLARVPLNVIGDAADARRGVLNVIEVTAADTVPEPGADTPAAGREALAALQRAVADLKEGKTDALVTAPINKHNIRGEGFDFAGHTEYLQAQAGDGAEPLMVLANDRMRVALVTTHLPVAQIAGAITKEAVLKKIMLFAKSLEADFGVHAPRIAVLGLNPHAGDGGLLGREEQEEILPAIQDARGQKVQAYGPYAADGFFGSGHYDRFDGILAMYHDQGLAPFKTLAMESGINFTAGLPLVRTSPDHGTGYDIAGKGEASADSMRAAIYAAADIVRRRRDHGLAHANPLRKA